MLNKTRVETRVDDVAGNIRSGRTMDAASRRPPRSAPSVSATSAQGLADIARHVSGRHTIQETRVQTAFDDVTGCHLIREMRIQTASDDVTDCQLIQATRVLTALDDVAGCQLTQETRVEKCVG